MKGIPHQGWTLDKPSRKFQDNVTFKRVQTNTRDSKGMAHGMQRFLNSLQHGNICESFTFSLFLCFFPNNIAG